MGNKDILDAITSLQNNPYSLTLDAYGIGKRPLPFQVSYVSDALNSNSKFESRTMKNTVGL
jgi:hypothetical protein